LAQRAKLIKYLACLTTTSCCESNTDVSNWTSVGHIVIKRTNVILIERRQLPYSDTTRTISEMSLSRQIWTGWSEKEPEFDLRTWISLCYFQNKKLKYWNKSTKSTEDTLMHTRSVRPIPTQTHFVISSKTKDNIFGFLRKWNWYYLYFWLRLQVSIIIYHTL